MKGSIEYVPTMPQNPLLVTEVLYPMLARLLLIPTSELAKATCPDFLVNAQSPVQWSGNDWDRLEANRQDIFDMSAVIEQFDQSSFLSDGYAVLKEIMTSEAIREWTEALKYGQQLNDKLLRLDWTQIDWHTLGRTLPVKSLTEDEINNALGGSQMVGKELRLTELSHCAG